MSLDANAVKLIVKRNIVNVTQLELCAIRKYANVSIASIVLIKA